MPKSRPFRFFIALSLGLVLRMIATGLEAMGDKAPLAAKGVSGERLMFHGAALLLTVGALACFVWALIVLFRKGQNNYEGLVSTFAEQVPVDSQVEAAPTPSPLTRRKQPQGFGRKLS